MIGSSKPYRPIAPWSPSLRPAGPSGAADRSSASAARRRRPAGRVAGWTSKCTGRWLGSSHRARQHPPICRLEDRPVDDLVLRPWRLAAEYGDLAGKLGAAATAEPGGLEDTTEGPAEERESHGGCRLREAEGGTARSRPTAALSLPTGSLGTDGRRARTLSADPFQGRGQPLVPSELRGRRRLGSQAIRSNTAAIP